MTQLTIDFGITAESIVTGSGVAPTLVSVPSILPKIEFSGHNVEVVRRLRCDSVRWHQWRAREHEFWLRKRQSGGVGL